MFFYKNIGSKWCFVLFQPFWKVTGDGNSQGIGVVGNVHDPNAIFLFNLNLFDYLVFVSGVLEANFIEPAHDKQDFERSSLFHRLEMRLKQMQLEYWCALVF